MPLVDRLDRLQRKHPAAGFPIAVVYKYVDDSGAYLAAIITYYGFVSLFPLLLLATTILGYALNGDPHLQQQILQSALKNVPVIGGDLGTPKRLGGGATGLVVGIVGALYGGLGVAQAAQHAMNTAWAVPRNNRPNPFKARARSLLLLTTAGIGLLGTSTLTAFGPSGAGSMGTALRGLVVLLSVLISAVAFVVAFRIATARDLSNRDVLPGAVLAAVLLQVLQSFGVTYVNHVVASSSATNGVFALVLGLVAFLYLASTLAVFCVQINAVRVDRLWPRALLTPFTDDVELTPGDERSYTGLATAQRSKGFEEVAVTFNPPADREPIDLSKDGGPADRRPVDREPVDREPVDPPEDRAGTTQSAP